jgi:polyhydroxyalkanoate synthesis regulator phasin
VHTEVRRMANIVEKALLMGLGAWSLTREKVSEAVNELVQEKEVEPEEARKLVDALVTKGEKEREELRKMIRQEMDQVRPVTRKEFEALSDKIDSLIDNVEQLSEEISSQEEN